MPFTRRRQPLKVAIDVSVEKRDDAGLDALGFDLLLQFGVAACCGNGIGQRVQHRLRRFDRRENAVPGRKAVIDAL